MRIDFADLMDFLEARIAEDEETAKALKSTKSEKVARLRDRALADAEAKRRLMAWVEEMPRRVMASESRSRFHAFTKDLYADQSLRSRSAVIFELVVAYADHPRFPTAWRGLLVESEEETATSVGS